MHLFPRFQGSKTKTCLQGGKDTYSHIDNRFIGLERCQSNKVISDILFSHKYGQNMARCPWAFCPIWAFFPS